MEVINGMVTLKHGDSVLIKTGNGSDVVILSCEANSDGIEQLIVVHSGIST